MVKKGNFMKLKGMDDEEEDGKDYPEDVQSSQMGGKLLAIQNMLEAIDEMSDEDLKPDIEAAKQKIHAAHEMVEGDKMGVKDAHMADDMMGQKDKGFPMDKPMEEDEEEEGMPKGGFLAILSKKLQSPKK